MAAGEGATCAVAGRQEASRHSKAFSSAAPSHLPVSSLGCSGTSVWKAEASWFHASWLFSRAATPPPSPSAAACGLPLSKGLPPAAAVASRARPMPAVRRRADS